MCRDSSTFSTGCKLGPQAVKLPTAQGACGMALQCQVKPALRLRYCLLALD